MVYVDPYCVKIVAGLREVRAELRSEAQTIAGRAKADLAGHRDDGDSKITVSRGNAIDYFVNLEDEGGGALAIEADLQILRRAART